MHCLYIKKVQHLMFFSKTYFYLLLRNSEIVNINSSLVCYSSTGKNSQAKHIDSPSFWKTLLLPNRCNIISWSIDPNYRPFVIQFGRCWYVADKGDDGKKFIKVSDFAFFPRFSLIFSNFFWVLHFQKVVQDFLCYVSSAK